VINSKSKFPTPKFETALPSEISTRLHGDTTQKTVIFMVTAVKTLNLLILCPEDRESIFPQNKGKFLPDDMALHFRIGLSSHSQPREFHTSQSTRESQQIRQNGSKPAVMDVIDSLCVSLGSSTVQLHDNLGSRQVCACSEACFSSSNDDRVWGVKYRRAAICYAVSVSRRTQCKGY
jgi:hypothetical protein